MAFCAGYGDSLAMIFLFFRLLFLLTPVFPPPIPPAPFHPRRGGKGSQQPYLALFLKVRRTRANWRCKGRVFIDSVNNEPASKSKKFVENSTIKTVKMNVPPLNTQPNGDVRSPFPPRRGWKGGWGDRGGVNHQDNTPSLRSNQSTEVGIEP